MNKPNRIYELLQDSCAADATLEQLLIGLVWTLCRSSGSGLSMSPVVPSRTVAWSGSLQGKPVRDVASWLLSWDPFQASVALAAVNSSINHRPIPDSELLEPSLNGANLSVFEYFLPQLLGKKVVVIGHYPGIERYQADMQLSVLERQPVTGDLPDTACEFVLPDADWVFLTASSLVNKTLPRLAELSRNAKTVLMGPSVPWLPQWHEFGTDYLAGVEVVDETALYHTVAQAGGVRIFEQGLRYRIAELTPNHSLNWIKEQIAACAAERQRLSQAMDAWYAAGNRQRFPDYACLEQANKRLSHLDSSYKPLWDKYSAFST